MISHLWLNSFLSIGIKLSLPKAFQERRRSWKKRTNLKGEKNECQSAGSFIPQIQVDTFYQLILL